MSQSGNDTWPTLNELLSHEPGSGYLARYPVSAEFVFFEEAINWIAHGTFGEPGIGPQTMMTTITDGLMDIGAEQAGREELARELLISRLQSEDQPVFGVLTERERPPESGEAEFDFALRRTLRIPASALSTLEISEGWGAYWINDKDFQSLFLSVEVLKTYFPPRSVGETTSAEQVDSSQVETPEDARRVAGMVARRGRPPKWDWEWLFVEIALLANMPDGLPEKQADLEDWAAEKFSKKYGSEPASSHIRKKVGPIYQALRSKMSG